MECDPKTPRHPRQRKAWSQPRLERLGNLSDIAAQPPPMLQANNNKFS